MIEGVKYLPKQIEALQYLSNESDVTELLYGGAKGSAKSVLGCLWQIERRMKYPGSKSIIGRSELGKLKKSTMPTLFEWMHRLGMVAGKHYRYNGQDLFIRFINGSEIHFFDLFDYPSDPDFTRFGGVEVMDVFVDEAAEVSGKCVSILKTLCRKHLRDFCRHCGHHEPRLDDLKVWNCKGCGKETGGLPIKLLMSCNPAKGWLYNDFYLPNKNNELPPHRAFLPALPDDNPYLSQEYIAELDALDEYDKQRLRYGNWEYDDDEGKMFDTHNLLACFREDNLLRGTKHITADVARFGRDRTIIIVWDGFVIVEVSELFRSPVNEVANRIKQLQQVHGVTLKNIIVDEDGIGGGVVDIIKCTGFINGSKPVDPAYQNIKAQCYYLLANKIVQGGIAFTGAMNLKDEIVRQFEQIKRHRPQADGKLNVTPKEEIKRKYGASPDHADAIMMRMYYAVYPNLGKYIFGGA